MRSKREILGGWSMGLGLLFLAVVGIASYRSAHRLTDSSNWVSHTLEVIGDVRRVGSDLIEAEDSQRGYELFHDEFELARAHDAMARIPPEIAEIRDLTGDNPRQRTRLDRLDVLVSRTFALNHEALSLTIRHSGEESAQQALYEQAKVVSSNCRQLLAEMENEERLLLVDREHQAVRETRITALIIGGGFVLALLLVTGAGGLGQWESARRRRSERALSAVRDNLSANLRDAEDRGRERNTLSELASRLQSCRNLAEGLPFMSRGMEQLFPEESGSIFLTSASRNILESAISWGKLVATESSFSPDDCWALRQGRLQVVDATDAVLRCAHLHPDAGRDAICLPLIGQGETLGVICHYFSSLPTPPGARRSEAVALNRIRMARLAGGQISLAVANLQLRETLRNQSIRDVLTGLFNRRYMEESLARECHRALRRKSSLAVMMVDIDHFKRFNDTYGHELGDRLLREFGSFLTINVRGEDIACRYGGEEFTLILPDAEAEGAAKRAEAIRQGAAQLSVPVKGGSTAAITISIGVALYPDHAKTPDALLQAADAALYRAKSEGRDRFAICESPVLS